MPALHRSSICPALFDVTQRRGLRRVTSRLFGWLLLCGAIGCSSGGGQAPPDVPVDLAHPAPIWRWCPASLARLSGLRPRAFADGTKPEDFSSQMAFEQAGSPLDQAAGQQRRAGASARTRSPPIGGKTTAQRRRAVSQATC